MEIRASHSDLQVYNSLGGCMKNKLTIFASIIFLSLNVIFAQAPAVSPLDGATGVAQSTTTFTWTDLPVGSNPNRYDFEIYTDAGYTIPLEAGQTDIVGTSATIVTALAFNTTYYWQVRDTDTDDNGVDDGAGDNGPYAQFSFTTILAAPSLTAPANLAAGVTIVPTFTWSVVTGAETYDLQVSTSSGFGTTVISQTGLASASYSVTTANQLSNSITYYWRVRAVRASAPASTSDWSSSRVFVTVASAMPYLTVPANGSTITGSMIFFSWWTTNLGGLYDLQIDDAADFLTPIQTFSNILYTNYYWTHTGLTPGNTYHWRIISKTNLGVIANYSATRTFIAPGLPTVTRSYPIGGVTVYTTAPTLFWYTGTFFSGQYQVRYRESTGAYPGVPQVTTSDQFTNLTGLTEGVTYYWQVRSTDGVNFGNWSVAGDSSFVIYGGIATPVVPFPSFPTNGVTVYSNPPTFFWYLGTWAPGLQFEVQYALDNTFSTGLVTLPLTSDLFATPAASLTAGTTYYWRVRSYNGSTFSAYSTAANFVTSSVAVPTPTPSWPIGGATVYELAPTLSWYAYSTATLEYQVNYSAFSSTGGSGDLNLGNTLSGWTGSFSYALSGLTPGVTYYWQVRARLASSPATISNWSIVVSFTTSAGALAVMPLIGSPNFGQPINNTSAVLSWIIPTKSSSPLTYDLQYSKKADLSDAKTISNVPKTFHQVTGLESGATYYWRVASKTNQGSVSNYSAVGSFRTGGITSVEEKSSIPTQFELLQNYPNPFNPTTKISYSLPSNSFVTIKIYDMLGSEVKTLINREAAAGKNTVEWNGDDNFGYKVSSGTYIYRITAGSFSASKKMILIK